MRAGVRYADTTDLYADAKPVQGNGITAVPSGPARVALHPSDVLSGTGKITDIEFGIAATDEGVRTYPQLVAIGGGTRFPACRASVCFASSPTR